MIYQHCLESMNLVWRSDMARDNAFVLSELILIVRVPKQLHQTLCKALWSNEKKLSARRQCSLQSSEITFPKR